MKLSINKLLKNNFLALFVIVLLASCTKEDSPATVAAENLDVLITANSDLSMLQAALKKTRLTTFTQGGGPFTLWAPNNAAFKAIGVNTETDLNALDSNLLVQILTYHIQATRRSFDEIPLGPNATMTTQGGYTQYASRKVGGSAYINGGEVTIPNILASNGYMHIINKVLIPPFFSMAASLSLNPNYKLMLQAITKTATVITTNPLVIFTVPNNIMIAAGYDSTAIANSTGTALTTLGSIMKYHMVNKRIFSSDFVTGALKTVQGGNLVIGAGSTITIKGTNNPAPFQVISGDFLAATGVIHGINGLLKP